MLFRSESMGSRLRDHTRIFNSGVRIRSNSRRTLPAEGIDLWSTLVAPRVAPSLESKIYLVFCDDSIVVGPPAITSFLLPTCRTALGTPLLCPSFVLKAPGGLQHILLTTVIAKKMTSRDASHAGSWYSSRKSELSAQLDQWLDQVPDTTKCIGTESSKQAPAQLPSSGARVIIAP